MSGGIFQVNEQVNLPVGKCLGGIVPRGRYVWGKCPYGECLSRARL